MPDVSTAEGVGKTLHKPELEAKGNIQKKEGYAMKHPEVACANTSCRSETCSTHGTCTDASCASATCKTHGATICTNANCTSKNCRVHATNNVNAVCMEPGCRSGACPIHGASATISARPVAPPAPPAMSSAVRPLEPVPAPVYTGAASTAPHVSVPYDQRHLRGQEFIPTDRREDMPIATDAKSIDSDAKRLDATLPTATTRSSGPYVAPMPAATASGVYTAHEPTFGDKVKGTFHEAAGGLKEATGRTFHNQRMESEGANEVMHGKAEKRQYDVTRKP